ncbi:MAG: tRNA glutamyl-Q(34) synthetase GluQRS [Pseudomonadota bacterium]
MAPSPTGYMHLGNAWSFLMAWLSVRQKNGTMVLRMEDIDPDRAKPHYMDALIQDLTWLGLDWDEGPAEGFSSSTASQNNEFCSAIQQNSSPHAPYVQSQCSELYIAVLNYLASHGHSYPCFCTRKELRAMAGAPHLGEACVYTGTCRHLTLAEQEERMAQGRKACIRLRCPDETIAFVDGRCGAQHISLTDCGGDFAIRRSDGVFAYQLAVVIDDMRMGITEIVRGDDLLHCTPRQIFLQSLLGQAGHELDFLPPSNNSDQVSIPSYVHIPLLLDVEGERFAKRHASLTIQSLREAGIPASCVLGYLAHLAGFIDSYKPLTAYELIPYFDVQRLPKSALRLLHDPFQTMLRLCEQGAFVGHKCRTLSPVSLACEAYGPVLNV